MVKYNTKLYGSIFKRSSIRNFQNISIRHDDFAQILKEAEVVSRLDESIRISVIEECPDNLFKGIIGSYGKIKNPQAYAVFIGNKNDSNIKEKIGYYGEVFILEAVSIGLGTCWISGTFEHDRVLKDISLSDEEQIFAVTPLGYPAENPGLESGILKFILRANQKKPIEEICNISTFDESQTWIKSALKAVRIGPSTRNIQPWYFEIDDQAILLKLSSKLKGPYKNDLLDCGIAMLHFELGAAREGIEGNWVYPVNTGIAEFQYESGDDSLSHIER